MLQRISDGGEHERHDGKANDEARENARCPVDKIRSDAVAEPTGCDEVAADPEEARNSPTTQVLASEPRTASGPNDVPAVGEQHQQGEEQPDEVEAVSAGVKPFANGRRRKRVGFQ
jgi:hypothetical protein